MHTDTQCNKPRKINKLLTIAVALIALSVILEAGIMFLSIVPYDFELVSILLTDAKILLMNIFPIFCILSFIYFVSNNIGIAQLITSILFFAVAMVNRLKLYYRDDPLVFNDFALIGEAGEMLKQYSVKIDGVALSVLALIAVISPLCFVLHKKLKLHSIRIRVGGAVLSATLLIVLGNMFYINGYDFHLSTWHTEFGSEYKAANQSMSRGAIYSLGRSINNLFDIVPEGYDEKSAKEIISQFETVPLDESKKVNVISIMLEAYNDFSKFSEVEFNVSPYENFHKLQKESYSGELYTNAFAADTIKTERSFLTGYGGSDFTKNVPTFVRYFKDMGYYTEAMHPGYGWFYNRKAVNEYLGFDNFDCYENKYSQVPAETLTGGTYQDLMCDIDFFDYIIEGYEKAVSRNQKYFNFSVTYQNHGPYDTQKLVDTEYAVKKPEYSDKAYNVFNNYLLWIKRTDDAIKKLRDYIDAQKEPIVLILFGDHNPFLGAEPHSYEMLGINLDTQTVEGAKNYYSTTYVFYANDAAKKALNKSFVGRGKTISPMFLMNELFEYADIDGPAYLNYLATVKQEYDVINTEYLGKDGDFILRGESQNNKTLLERQWVEYYLKKKGLK